MLSRLRVNGHRQHFVPSSPAAGTRHGGVLWKGQGGVWLAQNGGRWEMERVRGARGVSHRAKAEGAPALCTHRSLCQLPDSCGFPFPVQNALHKQIRCLWRPQCHHTEPRRSGGRVTLPRAEILPPVTEAEIQPEAGAAPEPTPLFPRATLSRAGRKGRKHSAAACRTQEGPDLA